MRGRISVLRLMVTLARPAVTGTALAFAGQAPIAAESPATASGHEPRVATVVNTPGCVAFWDFVKREPNGAHRFTAHVPAGATNDFALDAGNYVKDFWGKGRAATYADFAWLGRGPFGQAIRIRKEEDATFRPFLFVPRSRLHDSPLDIKGAGKSVSVVVWAIRESGNHALAGIWHEGTDLDHAGAAQVVARGQRQYALFAGLNKDGSACGHVSENGASSFGHLYAMHKSNSGDVSPAVPADSPAGVLETSWQCFAMTYDHESHELTGWLNGKDTGRWQEDIQKAIPVIHNAWRQGHLHREPGLQPGEDPGFPKDQFYNPPEDKPVSVKVLRETVDERVELQEFRYTRVRVTHRKAADGTWTTTARDLADVRLNPWWFPHDSLYSPANDGTGGPFTIGRVIHSSRGVGFTGWIGGVAVFNRALRAEEVALLSAIGRDLPARPDPKPRLFVLTDISNEPDDEESMVRLLVCANEFDLEGLVATTSTWLRHTTRVDLIHRQLNAYGQVRNNLLKHAPGFPTQEQLRRITAAGQTPYGLAAVGAGKATAGSRLLLSAADKADDRPLWVSVWGGANTLAQALFDARQERSPDDLKKLVDRLRVYTISDQDDAGPWLRREFPGLFYIVSPSTTDWKEYWRATWTGISGDRHYRNGPRHKFYLVDNPWLEANIIKNHGPLGALYPRLAYIMEGDTPSFLGLINNGLGWHLSPSYGGWGGRYALYQAYGETRPIWTNNQESRDTVTAENGQTECTDMATIWRWREAFQHDFAARLDWCVADEFKQANHHPIAILNGDTTKRVLDLTTRPGETVTLSAAGSRDPDGDAVTCAWHVYREAGTFPGEVTLSATHGETTSLVVAALDAKRSTNSTVHVILSATDRGTPPLSAYRRAVLTLKP